MLIKIDPTTSNCYKETHFLFSSLKHYFCLKLVSAHSSFICIPHPFINNSCVLIWGEHCSLICSLPVGIRAIISFSLQSSSKNIHFWIGICNKPLLSKQFTHRNPLHSFQKVSTMSFWKLCVSYCVRKTNDKLQKSKH